MGVGAFSEVVHVGLRVYDGTDFSNMQKVVHCACTFVGQIS
jgi:hypothetical protein